MTMTTIVTGVLERRIEVPNHRPGIGLITQFGPKYLIRTPAGKPRNNDLAHLVGHQVMAEGELIDLYTLNAISVKRLQNGH